MKKEYQPELARALSGYLWEKSQGENPDYYFGPTLLSRVLIPYLPEVSYLKISEVTPILESFVKKDLLEKAETYQGPNKLPMSSYRVNKKKVRCLDDLLRF